MDPDLDNVIRQALGDAQAAGKDYLTQTEEAVRAARQVRLDMAEQMFHHLALEKKYGKRGQGQYRDEVTRSHPDFGLLRDIADGNSASASRRLNAA